MKTRNILSVILGMVFSTNFALAADNYNCPMGGMMYGIYGGYGSGMMILSWVTYILIIALVVSAIYWFLKSANRKK